MRPRVDLFSLISGVLFVVLGGVFLLNQSFGVSIQTRWVWPVVLIGLGIAGLAGGRIRVGITRD